jgi:hypothetical protein
MDFTNKFFTITAERLGMVERITLVGNEGEYPTTIRAIITRNSRTNVNLKGQDTYFYPIEIMVVASEVGTVTEKKTKFIIKNCGKTKTVTVQEVLPQSDDYILHLGCN